MNQLHAVGVPGIGEVVAGQDLAATVVEALGRAGTPPVDGDILVISSKVVSKAEGRAMTAAGREPAVAAEPAGRGVGILRQQQDGADCDVRRVDPGGGQHRTGP